MEVLARLTQLYVANHAAVSVYLDLRLAEAGAGHDHYLLRWNHLRDELARGEADAQLLARLDDELMTLEASPHTAAVVANAEAVLRVDVDQRIDCAFPGPLPYGAPILKWLQDRVPYVVA